MSKIYQNMRIVQKLCYNPDKDDPYNYMNLYLPKNTDKKELPVIVYFHGGGLVHGNENIGQHWPAYMVDRGFAVVSAHYRMYPDAKFPDYLVDAARAVAYTKNNLTEYFTPGKIYIGGSSAGGYISMMLCFDTHYLKDEGIDPMEISGYIFDAGQPTTHFNVLKERGYDHVNDRQIIDEAAPIFHVGVEKEVPPMLILVADHDMQNRYEQTLLLAEALDWNGIHNYELHCLHSSHCRYTSRLDENGDSILGKFICEFIGRFEKEDVK